MESKTDITYDDEEEGEMVSWKVIDGAYVSADAVLLVYSSKSDEKKSLKTSVSGVVTINTTVKKGKVCLMLNSEFSLYIMFRSLKLVEPNITYVFFNFFTCTIGKA